MNYTGIAWLLATSPEWATFGVLMALMINMLPHLRDYQDGLPTDLACSSRDGGLLRVCIFMIAQEILRRDSNINLFYLHDMKIQVVVAIILLILGFLYMGRHGGKTADRYHNAIILPLTLFLLLFSFPVIFYEGTFIEKIAAIVLCIGWMASIVYDIRRKRMDQPFALEQWARKK